VLNDFGFRGVSVAIKNMVGQPFNYFDGSDTVIASKMIRDVYNTDTIFGKSIPATEHSIMTLKGEDGELELMERVLKHTQQVLLHVYLILISLELALNIGVLN
jgi:nicotinamide phosphoribosyltransferase